ncbi:hypothetical protein QZH41_011093 [Actinostola sp. cb2023]|nr:hypothetical protein QZH41_011093 [Actinostola sp. cb2023]
MNERLTLLSSRTPYDEFHRLFKNVPKDQFPINDFSCALSRDILLQGRLYISQEWFCFYSNIFGWETQVTINCSKIQSITREKTAYVVPNAILISTYNDKHFFSSFLSRESVYKLLIKVWEDDLAKAQEPLEESLLDNLPFHDLIEECDNADVPDTSYDEPDAMGYINSSETKLSSDSGFFDCQAPGILPADLDTDKHNMTGFDQTLEEEVHKNSSKLPSCANLALCVASIAEMFYSYFQVTSQLIRRVQKIVSANLEAISQIRETLKMLQEDLANQIHRNCTVIDKNICVNV